MHFLEKETNALSLYNLIYSIVLSTQAGERYNNNIFVLFRLRKYRYSHILHRLRTTQVECAVRSQPGTLGVVLLALGPLDHHVHEEVHLVPEAVLHVPALVQVQIGLANLQVLL